MEGCPSLSRRRETIKKGRDIVFSFVAKALCEGENIYPARKLTGGIYHFGWEFERESFYTSKK